MTRVMTQKKIWVMTRLRSWPNRSWPDWVMTQKNKLGHDRDQVQLKFLNTNYNLGIRSWPELGSWPKTVMTHIFDPIQNLGHDRDPVMTHNTSILKSK